MAATAATAGKPQEFALPEILTRPASTPPILIAQGAEGRLYKTTLLGRPVALKYRPPKPYRHPILDARLTKARIGAEAKILEKCRREGVPVPAVLAQDAPAGWMMVEWIEGAPVRQGINEWLGERPDNDGDDNTATPVEEIDQTPLIDLMKRIGEAVGGLHATGVIHGDLTTSNMMLKPPAGRDPTTTTSSSSTPPDAENTEEAARRRAVEGSVVLIDFGLATQSQSEEDRAVDLYVLERAFASTHPRAEKLFSHVLGAYRPAFKKAPAVLAKLEDVRMRGRKRSMLG